MLWNLLVKLINFVIKSLGYILNVALSLLPDSPFLYISNMAVSNYINSLAWIVPIGSMLSILQLWLVAIALYYIVSVFLRWAKAIG